MMYEVLISLMLIFSAVAFAFAAAFAVSAGVASVLPVGLPRSRRVLHDCTAKYPKGFIKRSRLNDSKQRIQ